MANRLTVIVPCRNEQENIGACLDSARDLADELIVADSGSTDATLDIVDQLGGCRVIRREYVNYASFNNWAVPQARHPWVLVLDADERLTPELAREIRQLLSGEPPRDGYQIRRRNFFLGREVRHSGWGRDWVLRLFRRDLSRHRNRRVHAGVEVSTGNVGRLNGAMLHYTVSDLSHFVARMNRYSTWSALDMRDQGRRTSLLGVLARPGMKLIGCYLLRDGFLDGTAGLLVSCLTAHYTLLKYAKLWCLGHISPVACRDGRPRADDPLLPAPAPFRVVHSAYAVGQRRAA